MATATKQNVLAEVGRTLAVAAILSIGTLQVMASRLDERVKANRELAQAELSSAIAVRRAEQQALINDQEQVKEVLKELLPVVKELSKGQSDLKESVARIEVAVNYLTKSQDEIKRGK